MATTRPCHSCGALPGETKFPRGSTAREQRLCRSCIAEIPLNARTERARRDARNMGPDYGPGFRPPRKPWTLPLLAPLKPARFRDA